MADLKCRRLVVLAALLPAVLALFLTCSKSSSPDQGDVTPPSPVSDLRSSVLTSSSIALTWTAPGDDGSTGRASQYDIRFSTSTITDANWASSTPVASEPTPSIAGSGESFTVTGLTAGTTFYFAIKTADEKPNWSNLSNIVSATTNAASDVTPPSAVSNLATTAPTTSTITLIWAAPGDDGSTGTASQYDIRYSTSNITEANWASATQATGEPTPKSAGSSETFTITGLSAGTTYYFALKTADERPNWSDLSNVKSATLPEGGPGPWSPLGSGMNDQVFALTVYNGNLIAGGRFTMAGGTSANHITSWDGAAWSPLGSGMSGDVYALTVYNGKLIAGGGFATAGGTSANYIASWDGTGWSPLGSGMNNGVSAITVYNGKLIAGGYFTTAGGTSTNNIASWDGIGWSPLGSGMNGISVAELIVYNGKLIAGGGFTTAGGTSANNIASWDGAAWSPLGSGMGGTSTYVYVLTVCNGSLIAGGNFTTAGGTNANRIASWDGTGWSPLGSGMSYYVEALTVYNGNLIAGGNFSTAGGTSVNCIASWDGIGWSPLGSGMGGTNFHVKDLTVYNGNLIAGGNFTTAGGTSANNIAAWSK